MEYNVHEAKANLSKLLKLAAKGEKIYICKRNIRIAELNPVGMFSHGRRIPGAAKGLVDDAIMDIPLDEEIAMM